MLGRGAATCGMAGREGAAKCGAGRAAIGGAAGRDIAGGAAGRAMAGGAAGRAIAGGGAAGRAAGAAAGPGLPGWANAPALRVIVETPTKIAARPIPRGSMFTAPRRSVAREIQRASSGIVRTG